MYSKCTVNVLMYYSHFLKSILFNVLGYTRSVYVRVCVCACVHRWLRTDLEVLNTYACTCQQVIYMLMFDCRYQYHGFISHTLSYTVRYIL
jgi:hypothetical protein